MTILDKNTTDLILNLEKRVERLERDVKALAFRALDSRRREEDPLAYAEARARNEEIKKANENLDRQRGCYIEPESPTAIEVNEIRQTVDGKVYVSLLSSPAMVFDLKTAKLISAKLNLVIDRIEA